MSGKDHYSSKSQSRRNVLKGLGALGAVAVGSSSLSGSASAAIGDSAVYQYYHTDWSTITNNLSAVANAGYDAIQVPPAQFSRLYEYERDSDEFVYHQPLGYQPIDFTNFNSVFGTESEYQAMVNEAHNQGLDVIADAVMNHLAAGGNYFDRQVSMDDIPRFSQDDLHPSCDINYNDPESVEDCWLVGLRDLDQSSSYVRGELYNYLAKYANLGVDGVRFDAAKHIPEWFFRDYATQWADDLGLYKVGEVLDGSTAVNQGYADTGMSVTDYALYFVMKESVFNSSGDMNALDGAGLVNQSPQRAMTFVSNHDQGPPEYERLAYAYILTYEGYPRVYNHRVGASDSEISTLLSIRRQLLSGSARTRYVDTDLYVFERGDAIVVLNRGTSQRSASVQTAFSSGTTLSDVTGSSSDTQVDSNGYVQVTAPAVGYAVYSNRSLDGGGGDGGGSAFYDVANLASPGSATEGDVITVSADVTNTGDADGSKTVEFRVDGTAEQSTSRSLAVGDTTSVSFDYDTSGLADGSHTVGIATPDDSQSASLDVATGGTTLQIQAPTASGESVYFTGSTTTLTNWGGGVEGTNTSGDTWEVSLSDTSSFEWKVRRGPSGSSGDVWEGGSNHTSSDLSPSFNGWEDGFTGGSDGGDSGGTTVQDGATYAIQNVASGKALDVSGVSTDNGADIHVWDYLEGANQHWTVEATGDGYYRLTPNHTSGKCLDVSGGTSATQDGANVHQWDYFGNGNQQWSIESVDGGFLLRARHSNKVAEAMGTANGDTVQQQSEHGGDTQIWTLTQI